jgi:lipoic acid synthetase
MLGLGEDEDEILVTMKDLHKAGCKILTIGQYLQPGKDFMDVVNYITPDKFREYKEKALEMGFDFVESSPLIRSSFHAENHINAGEK